MEPTPQPERPAPDSVPAQVVAPPPPPAAPKKRRSGARVLGILIVLFVMGFLGLLLAGAVVVAAGLAGSVATTGTVREEFVSHNRRGRDKVAILSVQGAILDGEGFVKRQIDRARRDAGQGNLKAVVVRVNSPGGTVSGSDFIYHHLRRLREETDLPMVVSMGGIAASGGYYVSMAVGDTPQSIYAEPTTWTGSIGVIIPHYDLSGLLDHIGIEESSIARGELKGMGSLARPMTEKEEQIFQGLVDEGYNRFKDVIRDGRPAFQKDAAALDEAATGQIFTAVQAKNRGLVDEIGYVEDAVERAIALAGLDKENVKVVRYKPEPTLMDILFGAEARPQTAWDPAALLEMTVPRAYYLCTWLPPLGGMIRP
jgi:protease IV